MKLRAQLEEHLTRTQRILYIDPVDVRYRRLNPHPPIAKAVMFCLMDVSGSMNEHMKDLAKRFYSLLYLFSTAVTSMWMSCSSATRTKRRRWTSRPFSIRAKPAARLFQRRCSSMQEIVKARYPVDQWNIYAAQASDGDNTSSDNSVVVAQLKDVILPICQYYAYVEVGMDDEEDHPGVGEPSTNLWRAYKRIGDDAPFAMRKVKHRRDIYPVFRELFSRQAQAAENA